MSKKKLCLLIISTIGYVVLFYALFLAYTAFYVKPLLLSYPAALRPYIDYDPFFATWFGKSAVVIGGILACSWVAIGIQRVWRKLSAKKVLTTVITATLILGVVAQLGNVPVVQARWNCYNHIDILAVRDEEFAEMGLEADVEAVLADVSENRFENHFDISLHLRGWVDWDSDDGKTCPIYLCIEAINDLGYEEGIEYDGYWIDLLLIFTGQNMDIRGWGYPFRDDRYGIGLSDPVMIVRYNEINLHVLTHELGHQYYLDHCGDPWCVMNVDWQWGDDFCSGCQNDVMNERDKWQTDKKTFH